MRFVIQPAKKRGMLGERYFKIYFDTPTSLESAKEILADQKYDYIQSLSNKSVFGFCSVFVGVKYGK